MECPRCRLTLTESEYEGQAVRFCTNCWGYWLTKDQLTAIVSGGDYQFSRGEVQAVAKSHEKGDADRQGSEGERIDCPVCGKRMKRGRVDRAVPVVIDECPQHGVWLDTGEIKDLQVYLEGRIKR